MFVYLTIHNTTRYIKIKKWFTIQLVFCQLCLSYNLAIRERERERQREEMEFNSRVLGFSLTLQHENWVCKFHGKWGLYRGRLKAYIVKKFITEFTHVRSYSRLSQWETRERWNYCLNWISKGEFNWQIAQPSAFFLCKITLHATLNYNFWSLSTHYNLTHAWGENSLKNLKLSS